MFVGEVPELGGIFLWSPDCRCTFPTTNTQLPVASDAWRCGKTIGKLMRKYLLDMCVTSLKDKTIYREVIQPLQAGSNLVKAPF